MKQNQLFYSYYILVHFSCHQQLFSCHFLFWMSTLYTSTPPKPSLHTSIHPVSSLSCPNPLCNCWPALYFSFSFYLSTHVITWQEKNPTSITLMNLLFSAFLTSFNLQLFKRGPSRDLLIQRKFTDLGLPLNSVIFSWSITLLFSIFFPFFFCSLVV